MDAALPRNSPRKGDLSALLVIYAVNTGDITDGCTFFRDCIRGICGGNQE